MDDKPSTVSGTVIVCPCPNCGRGLALSTRGLNVQAECPGCQWAGWVAKDGVSPEDKVGGQ